MYKYYTISCICAVFAETNPIFIRDINWLYGRGACWEWGQQMGSMPAKGGWGGRVLSQSADRKKHLKTLLLLMRRAAV
jgi:hypothetical protein